jgi:hypothetical protein
VEIENIGDRNANGFVGIHGAQKNESPIRHPSGSGSPIALRASDANAKRPVVDPGTG